jgi:hypothetical protein
MADTFFHGWPYLSPHPSGKTVFACGFPWLSLHQTTFDLFECQLWHGHRLPLRPVSFVLYVSGSAGERVASSCSACSKLLVVSDLSARWSGRILDHV